MRNVRLENAAKPDRLGEARKEKLWFKNWHKRCELEEMAKLELSAPGIIYQPASAYGSDCWSMYAPAPKARGPRTRPVFKDHISRKKCQALDDVGT